MNKFMRRNSFIAIVIWFFMLTSVLSLCGCGGGGGGGSSSGSTDAVNTATLAPNAKELDATTINNLSSVSSDGATITFSGTTPQVASLKPGDVIVSGVTATAPRGLLRKVVSSQKTSDGSVQVITSPAALTEAFEELHVEGATTLGALYVSGAIVTGPGNITYTIPKTPFSISGQWSSELSGNFTYNPVIDFEIDISKFTLNKFKLALRGPATLDMGAELTIMGALSASDKAPLVVVPVFLGTVPTPIPSVVLTFEFIPSVGLSIEAGGAITGNFGFKSSATVAAGIEYNPNTHRFQPVSETPFKDYSFYPYSSIDGTAAINFKPYFSAKFGCYINSVAGPYFDLQPYGQLSQIITAPRHLEAGVGITGNAGGELKFLSESFGEIEFQLFDLYFPLWSSYDDAQAITDVWMKFDDFFATSLPSPTNPQLLALFDAGSFLDNGYYLNTWLTDVTTQPNMIGFKITNVVIKEINSTSDEAWVSLEGTQGGQTFSENTNGPGLQKMVKKSGVWKFAGNQRIAQVNGNALALYFPNSTDPAYRFQTGLSINVNANTPVGASVASAVVTGPGIPAPGLTLTRQTAYEWFAFPGQTGNYYNSINDATIGSIPDNSVYTFKLRNSSGTVLATYTGTLRKRPLMRTELSAVLFPTITAPTVTALQAFNGGNLTATWTLPAGLNSQWIQLQLADTNWTKMARAEAQLSTSDRSKTLTIQPVTSTGVSFTPVNRQLYVHGRDAYDRQFATALQ